LPPPSGGGGVAESVWLPLSPPASGEPLPSEGTPPSEVLPPHPIDARESARSVEDDNAPKQRLIDRCIEVSLRQETPAARGADGPAARVEAVGADSLDVNLRMHHPVCLTRRLPSEVEFVTGAIRRVETAVARALCLRSMCNDTLSRRLIDVPSRIRTLILEDDPASPQSSMGSSHRCAHTAIVVTSREEDVKRNREAIE
jgi:hypothetical protein